MTLSPLLGVRAGVAPQVSVPALSPGLRSIISLTQWRPEGSLRSHLQEGGGLGKLRSVLQSPGW